MRRVCRGYNSSWDVLMNVAFWDNQIGERGTTVSLYDYAHYNETILGNKSYIFYDKNNPHNKAEVVEKFMTRFDKVHGVDDFSEVDDCLVNYNVRHIYAIKSGELDNIISNVARNCIHCVFNCHSQHGDVYSCISPVVHGFHGQYPVVPHMINLPIHDENMRNELNIPENAVVFGGYGGSENFNIEFVQNVVFSVAASDPSIYFLFANFDRFCPDLPNIIHLPTIVDLSEKVRFINTCDANLWARQGGETFGLSIGEFSTLNKPVIATKHCQGDKAHVHMLGDKGLWYSNEDDLLDILLNFDPVTEKTRDWNAYREYTPEKIMKIFKHTFLDDVAVDDV